MITLGFLVLGVRYSVFDHFVFLTGARSGSCSK